MESKQVRVRFAPSPTGYLHVGNARTALFNWLFARQKQGKYVLRVEDTDPARSSPEFEEGLIKDLRWLGLDWDEGPEEDGPYGPYRQSLRADRYREAAQKLLHSGKAYHCFCSPEELEADRQKALEAGKTPVYSGRCRHLDPEEAGARLAAGEAASLRLRTPGKGELVVSDLVRGEVRFDLAHVGDPILVRSSGLPAYNYAAVVDDFLMRITHVIRGEDHLANTVRQILIYRAFDYPPPLFAHLSLVMGQDNTRLSKRHGATSVEQFERQGILPSALLNYLALLGWAPPQGRNEVLDAEELVSLFDIGKVSRASAIFDYSKLFWLNRQHMLRLPVSARVERVLPHLRSAGLISEELNPAQRKWLEQAVDILLERADSWARLADLLEQLFDFPLESLDEESWAELTSDCGVKVVKAFALKLSETEQLDFEAFAAITKTIKAETGCKGRQLYHPLRLALTGRGSGLDLDKFIPLVESGAKIAFARPLLDCASRIAKSVSLLKT